MAITKIFGGQSLWLTKKTAIHAAENQKIARASDLPPKVDLIPKVGENKTKFLIDGTPNFGGVSEYFDYFRTQICRGTIVTKYSSDC